MNCPTYINTILPVIAGFPVATWDDLWRKIFIDRDEAKNAQGMFVCLSGSRAYGLDNNDSDFDIRGVFVIDPRLLLGIMPHRDLLEYNEFRRGQDSKMYELDFNMYDIGFFMQQIVKWSPNFLEMLDENVWLSRNDIADKIVSVKRLLVSKNFARKVLTSGTHILDSGEITHRGWKKVSHILRMLNNMRKLLTHNQISIYETDEQWVAFLKRVKQGMEKPEDVKKRIADLKDEVSHMIDDSELPDDIDNEVAVNVIRVSRLDALEMLGAFMDESRHDIQSNDRFQISLVTGETIDIFIADPMDILGYPLCDVGNKKNSKEIAQILRLVHKGNPTIISSLYSGDNDSVLSESPLGKWLYDVGTRMINENYWRALPHYLRQMTSSKRANESDEHYNRRIRAAYKAMNTAKMLRGEGYKRTKANVEDNDAVIQAVADFIKTLDQKVDKKEIPLPSSINDELVNIRLSQLRAKIK